VAIAVELLALPLLLAAGVGPLEQNLNAGSPALLPVAQVIGGLIFGVGIALAGGCIAGILWKTGAGSIATAMAIAGFAVGELIVQGAGATLLGELDDASRPSEGSLAQITGLPCRPRLGVHLPLWSRRRCWRAFSGRRSRSLTGFAGSPLSRLAQPKRPESTPRDLLAADDAALAQRLVNDRSLNTRPLVDVLRAHDDHVGGRAQPPQGAP